MNSMKFVDDKGNFLLSTLSTVDTENATKTLETLGKDKEFEFEVVDEPAQATPREVILTDLEGPHEIATEGKQARPKQIIGPDGLTLDGKVPYGHRQCGHCQHVVKGPRTLVCPKCNTEFGKRKPNGPARSKMVQRTKTNIGQVRQGLQILKKGNDPWAIENRTELYAHDTLDKRNNVKQFVTALIPRETSTVRAMEYAKMIRLPQAVQFPNTLTLDVRI